MLQADLETQQPEEAAKLTSESEKEASTTSTLKEQEPELHVQNQFLKIQISDSWINLMIIYLFLNRLQLRRKKMRLQSLSL